MRLFAGPDGSGKSSVFRAIAGQHNVGVCVDADELGLELMARQGLLLRRFHDSLTPEDLSAFYGRHPLRLSFGNDFPFVFTPDGRVSLSLTSQTSQKVSAAASLVADYVRERLLESGVSMSCETVLAQPSELAWVRQAKKNGYHVYLYYICVSSPLICMQRVALRVKHGGHAVSEVKIAEGYEQSLARLKEAVALSDRAFLFDNTYSGAALKLAIRQGSEVTALETQLPEWLTRSLPPLVPRA